jgi:hypothetical protein
MGLVSPGLAYAPNMADLRRRWMFRVHRNVKEVGIIKLSAVNNSMNNRREHQIIIFQVSKLCYLQEELYKRR